MTSGKALQPSFLYATQLPQPSDRWGLSTPRPPHRGGWWGRPGSPLKGWSQFLNP